MPDLPAGEEREGVVRPRDPVAFRELRGRCEKSRPVVHTDESLFYHERTPLSAQGDIAQDYGPVRERNNAVIGVK